VKKVIVFSYLFAVITAGCSSMDDKKDAPEGGLLKPCPSSPNCVSSLAEDPLHAIAPINHKGLTIAEAAEKMLSILKQEKRCTIVKAETGELMYIHAEYRSAVFRFTDDVEFLFSSGENLIHVRSASRTGYSDFGVNRKRIEHLRELFNK